MRFGLGDNKPVALVMVAGFLCASLPAWAAGTVGKATFIKGTVQRGTSAAGPFEDLRKGQDVMEGDVVKTGPSSRAEIRLGDGSALRLASNSTLQMGMAKGKGAASPADVTVTTGALWARIAKVAGGDQGFSVRTPNAVAGVRGTIFGVYCLPDGRTAVGVVDGLVSVTGTGGPKSVDLGPEFGVVVSPTGNLEDAIRYQQILDMASQLVEEDWNSFNRRMDANPGELDKVVDDAEKSAGKKPEEDAQLKVQNDVSRLNPKEMVNRSEQMLTEMRASLRQNLELIAAARKDRDIVRLNCLNERVTQMKGVLKVAEDAHVSLQEQAATGDQEGARASYTKVVLAKDRVATLRVQAQNCVGSESFYGGTTQVDRNVDPALAGGDPFFGGRGIGDNGVGDFSNGTKTVGDNTVDSPPPPQCGSCFQ